MPIDPKCVGSAGGPVERSWTSKDCLLYALGVGAGTGELAFSTEKNQRVLPTFAVIVGGGGIPFGAIGSFNPAMLVHGERRSSSSARSRRGQRSLQHGPDRERLGQAFGRGGRGGIRFGRRRHRRAALRTRMAVFIRGEAASAASAGLRAAQRAAGESRTRDPLRDAARSGAPLPAFGDRNPLHSDPEFARKAGFEADPAGCAATASPGARCCTVSAAGIRRFRSMEARFSKPVYPGDALTVSIWADGDTAVFRTSSQGGDVVIDQGRFTFTR
jgi:hypothetical protein